MDELRVPKISVAIRCHTVSQETLSGEIFLDMMSSAGFTKSQVLEFFNSTQLFFPLKTESGKSILIQKQMLLRVDIPELFSEYESEVFSSLDFKKEAALHFASAITIRGSIIVDMPKEHARILDVLNSGRTFIPVLLDTTLSLINTHHILNVEEV